MRILRAGKRDEVDSWPRHMKSRSAIAVLFAAIATVAIGCSGASSSDSGGNAGGLPEATGDPVPAIKILGPSPAYDSGQNEAMQVVGEGLEQIGLTVEYEGMPDFGTFAETAAQGEFDVAASGYIGTLPRLDPSQLMGSPFLCDSGPDSNFSGYCNEEYDEIFGESLVTVDEDERGGLVNQAQQILAEDLPMVVAYYPTVATLYNSEAVADPVFSPATGYFNFWTFTQAKPTGTDGVLAVGFAERGTSINPTCNSGGYFQEQEYQTLVYDTLTRIEADGGIVNWAAEDISIDGPNVTIKLRPGMVFHDGSPVTAEDVAFTMNYMKEWQVGQYLDVTDRVKSAKATNKLTVEMILSEPYAPLRSSFAQIPILPHKVWGDVVESEGLESPCDWSKPNYLGSGPYVFESFNPNQAIRLSRFDDHFQPAAAAEFVGRYYATAQSLFLDLMAGSVYLHDSDPGFTPSQVEEAENSGTLTVTREPSITVRWMSFNTRDSSPFADPALRKAAAHLVDYELITGGILQGQGTEGAGVLAPANERWHDSSIEWPRFDLAAAEEILAEAGYGVDENGALHFPGSGSGAESNESVSN